LTAKTGRAHRRRMAAVTLAEVLVSLVVMGVGLVSVISAFSVCSRAVGIARGQVVAENFAASIVAQMRENPGLLMSGDSGEVGPDYPGFTWKSELRESAEEGVLAVRVTVEWKSQGLRRDYTLVSLVETAKN